MVLKLDQVVPFGRSLDEYIKMFRLTESDQRLSILSVADGPASFNAEGSRLGYRIHSVDPLYQFTAAEIRSRFEAVVDTIIEQVEQTPEDWVWTYHGSPQGLRKNRERSLNLFCEDFQLGQQQGRYEVGELPILNYPDQSFDLGLCSHFLFLYSDHLDEAFHWESIKALVRVCREVRIFPLLTLMLQPSPYLQPIRLRLKQEGYDSQLCLTSYELQRGGNQMLKITTSQD